jgi:hypothetical protein
MPQKYEVSEGDCINSIALQFGFIPDTIWNHSDNQKIKQQREDPALLMEGDELTIPDKTRREEQAPAESRTTFRRLGVPAKLRIVLEENGEALSDLDCRVSIDGCFDDYTTDSDGLLEFSIPPDAKNGWIEATKEDGQVVRFDMNLGHLDPYTEVSGVQQRLANLGLYFGDITAELDNDTEAALDCYCDSNEIDRKTKSNEEIFAAVRDSHGT